MRSSELLSVLFRHTSQIEAYDELTSLEPPLEEIHNVAEIYGLEFPEDRHEYYGKLSHLVEIFVGGSRRVH